MKAMRKGEFKMKKQIVSTTYNGIKCRENGVRKMIGL